MGISIATLHNILSGRTSLTLERAIVFANSLKMPIGNLLADPERPNNSSLKSANVPEIRYDKNYMVLQQCRLRAAEYENLDIVDIKRKIRINLKHLLRNNHEVWDTGDCSIVRPWTSATGIMHASYRAQKPTRRKNKCLATSERFFSHITTSSYHDSMGFRPQTLYNVSEGNRSLQLREALVIMHVFDCDLDFKREAIPNSPTRLTKNEIRSILQTISVACDEIVIINQEIKDFQISQKFKHEEERISLDFTYTDVIHIQYPQLQYFSSNEAVSLALIKLDKKLDTPEWAPVVPDGLRTFGVVSCARFQFASCMVSWSRDMSR
jgi:transcriptional regulator with XRE-family HTH domain